MRADLIGQYATKMGRESGTPATAVEAEAEILRVVRTVAANLSRHLRFGYHTDADIEQEGVLIGLVVLEKGKYDVARPLENFLHVHVKNQLLNFKRKHFLRSEAPCTCCEAFGSPAEPCPRWLEWNRRNASKQNLMRPLDVSTLGDEGQRAGASRGGVADEVATREILDRIDAGLTPDLRADYLRMRAGVSVPKGRRQRVREAVLAIVGDGDLDG